jgi:UDP-glucuronate 4-epimerase
MKILITGAAGFIGFHLSKSLLEFKKNKIYAIDNLDNYYSVRIKKKRIQILQKNKNFFFNKIDVTSSKLFNYLKNKNFDIVIHLAAQAGVRYSILNPEKYLNTNILGFSNIFENLSSKSLKKVIYASSSSVYGDTNNFPTNETNSTQPKNIYGNSKIINEHMSKYYSSKLNVPFIGLRFFTVYGTWGRPDMFILKVLNNHFKKKTFYLNNKGNHLRDFTSINDVVQIILKLIYKDMKNNCVYNICSNNPILISNVLKKIEKKVGKINFKTINRNSADVLNTHGDNTKVIKETNFKKFSNFSQELDKVINWFEKVKDKNYF